MLTDAELNFSKHNNTSILVSIIAPDNQHVRTHTTNFYLHQHEILSLKRHVEQLRTQVVNSLPARFRNNLYNVTFLQCYHLC